MKIEEKYSKAFNEPGGPVEKIDRLLYEVELNLCKKAKRGNVSYRDIYEEIMDARLTIKYLI